MGGNGGDQLAHELIARQWSALPVTEAETGAASAEIVQDPQEETELQRCHVQGLGKLDLICSLLQAALPDRD